MLDKIEEKLNVIKQMQPYLTTYDDATRVLDRCKEQAKSALKELQEYKERMESSELVDKLAESLYYTLSQDGDFILAGRHRTHKGHAVDLAQAAINTITKGKDSE